MSDLDLLLAEGIIDEICGRLKSGKEADISAVRRGDQILAAKVYKDRATRSFKNNADYKEGRKVRNTRTQRAIDSGGKFGRDSEEQAWKSAEADALYKLVGSGVRVPAPVMFYEGVLLMELVAGADGQVAPRLIDVAIPPDDAMGIYADLLSQIISMLCCDLIHGDLSPYNILLGADGPTIIDFPQVVSAAHSTRAEFFFLRDFDNVLRFLVGFDPTLAIHRADGRAVWRAYVGRELTPQFVPPPPPPPSSRREERRFDRPRNDRGPRGPRIDNRGPQQRTDGRGPPPPRDDARGLLQRSDRTFDTRGSQPGDRNAPRTDGRRGPPSGDRGSPRTDNRGPQPADRGAGDLGQRTRRSYGERFAGEGGAPDRDPRNGGPPQAGDRGSQQPPRDDFDWSQPRRPANQPGSQPPQRNDRPASGDARNPPGQRNDRFASSDTRYSPGQRNDRPASSDARNPPRNDRAPSRDRSDAGPRGDRPRPSGPAFGMPPPRAPRARVDPRPPPPSGGHRRRPKRRS